MSQKGIRILEIRRGSAAEKIGLAPGDRILTVNGKDVPDELALRFYLSGGNIDLHVLRPNGAEEHFHADLPDGTDWGFEIEEFRTRTCNNACIFCFVDQLPPVVRPALKIKDDDYRLSFLHGNYITLTNLSGKELDRIVEHRLSPLYVSIHATDPNLRARILGRKSADDLDSKLRKLVQGGIRLHAQIVLMPGINDGKHLEKTIFDLRRLYPGIQSVAVVPLGLADHGMPRSILTPVTPDFSREVIRRMAPWQALFREQTGRTFTYLADEFFIQGGRDVPAREYYDEFAQVEDGVGMVRLFLDDFEAEFNRRRRRRAIPRATLVTGRLFYPTLRRCVRLINARFGSRLQICRVENRFLGNRITVAGLLGGEDILHALSGKETGDFIVIPQEAVSQTCGLLIDDYPPEYLSRRLGKPVYLSGRTPADFFRLVFSD